MPFLEDYILLDELGQGGFATVYKVKHRSLGYIRAVRVLHQLIAKGEEDKTYQKFLRECRILLRLGNGNHPNNRTYISATSEITEGHCGNGLC